MEETQQINASSHSMEASYSAVHTAAMEAGKVAPEAIAPKGYLPFVEARKFAVSLNLKTRKEWRSYVKGEMPHLQAKPANVPAHPDGIYKVKGWQGWKYWLGTADVGMSQANTLQQ